MWVKVFSSIFLVLFITACGGGGGGSSSSPPAQQPPASGGGGDPQPEPEPEPEPTSYVVSGSGVKGPLANATVNLYRLDASAENLAGELIATGTTDSQAQLQGISVTDPSGEFLLEFVADDDTIDLTSGAAPVLSRLTTFADADRLATESRIYATPLTTLALNLGQERMTDGQSNEDLLASLAGIQAEIRSTLGFGLGDDVDLFETPPIVDEDTITLQQQQRVTAYRKAVEAFSAVVNQVATETGASADAVASAVAEDLADGALDSSEVYSASRLVELGANPDSLVIPGEPSNRTVGDVKDILIEEKAATGNSDVVTDQLAAADDQVLSSLATDSDYDNDGVLNVNDADDDGDGVDDASDAFPTDATETKDSDGDGSGDNADTDDDNDGVADSVDAFPFNPSESSDADGDGIGDVADTDDDNDGLADSEDPFPLDADETADADGDGIGNVADPDDDNDGVLDAEDAFPLDETESADTDADGIGNNADDDDDNDGVADAEDMFPLNADESMDSDGDGIGNNEDEDDDGDGVADSLDYDPLNPDITNPPVSSGGGSGGGSTPPPAPTLDISGGGIKGPLVNADVTLYQIDTSAPDFKGPVAGTATTNAQAQIAGLQLTFPFQPVYLIEFTSNPGTTDLTTGQYPVITEMRSVLTQDQLTEQIYATPLTTMAVDLAIRNAGPGVSEAAFLAELELAGEQVKATMGFGVGEDVDIFDTPPLIDDSTDTPEEQSDAAAYRSAVEAMTAVVYQMQQLGGDDAASTDDIIGDLAADLADGEIDGVADGQETGAYVDESLDLFEQDPATLPIPGAINTTVGDVKDLVIAETVNTGSATDTSDFQADTSEIELKPAETNPDIDGDGVPNGADAFPEDASADTDSDGDGIPDVVYDVTAGVRNDPPTIDLAASDADDDNDDVLDVDDAFPFDPTEYLDTDNDGIGNTADSDDDADGVNDIADDFPLDATRFNATDQDNDGWETDQDPDDNNGLIPEVPFVDTDGDGLADEGGLTDDTDDDNDGVLDVDDAFPLNASESRDLDGDGIGNKSDTDIDGDGVNNDDDRFPFDATESIDTDRDGVGNNRDDDDDGDGLSDGAEENLGTDPLDSDSDNDGALDNVDALPLDPTETFDTDSDGIGNNTDNCKLIPNPSQVNTDGDDFGDQCDSDDDADGVADVNDAFPLDDTETTDTDGDGEGDVADSDDDGDGVADANDAFPLDATESVDTDGDGEGNRADTDDDNDGVLDADDPSPLDPNITSFLDQDGDGWPVGQDPNDDPAANGAADPGPSVPFVDTDGDGLANSGGLNPDPDDDNDGVADGEDLFPLDPLESADLDNDTIGDNADPDVDGDDEPNTTDAFPRNPAEQFDNDGDGVGDVADADDDNDGVLDVADIFPKDSSEFADADSDGVGDVADTDDDNDGILDVDDAFPFDDQETADSDSDGLGDNADNCPTVAGAQTDTDGDGEGNPCDTDDDGDGTLDVDDDLPLDPNETVDTDGDGIGNVADLDDDNDGTPDTSDAFPLDPTQSADTDNDGIGDALDNCPNDANAGQEDLDGDGQGDACDNSYTPVDMPTSIQLIPQLPAGISNVNVPGSTGNGNIYFFNPGQTGRVVASTGAADTTWYFNGNDELVIDFVDAFVPAQVETEIAVGELVNGGQITQAEADAYLPGAPFSIEVTTQVVQVAFAIEDPVNGRGQLTRTSLTTIKTYPTDLFTGSVQIDDSTAVTQDWIDRSSFAYEPFTEAELTSSDWGSYLPIEWWPGFYLLAADEFTFNAGSGATANLGGSFSWSISNGFLNISHANGTQQSLRKVERDGELVGVSIVYATPAGGLHADYLTSAPFQAAPVDFNPLEDTFMQTGISLKANDAYDGPDLKTEWIFGFVLNQDGQSIRVVGKCDDAACNNPFVYNEAYFPSINGNDVTWESRRLISTGERNAVCDVADADCEVWRTREWSVQQQVGNRIYVLESDVADFGAGPAPAFPPRLNFYEPYARADLDNDGVDSPTDVFPFDTSETTDTDGDGFGDNSDNCVNDAGPQDDFDGDGAGDICDADDDGDGTPDATDAFPFDPTEDTDNDNDGVGDNIDLDPNDPNVGAGSAFSSASLAASYVQLITGFLADPALQTGQTNGTRYLFDQAGTGSETDRFGERTFTWSITDDEMLVTPDAPAPTSSFPLVSTLVGDGLVSQSAGDAYILANGDVQIEITDTLVESRWRLITDTAGVDTYIIREVVDVQIVEDSDRAALFGNVGAAPVQQVKPFIETVLTESASLTTQPFVSGEIPGEWGIVAELELNPSHPTYFNTHALATFTGGGAGSTNLGGNFTWTIVAGDLVMTFDDGTVIRHQRLATWSGNAYGVLSTSTATSGEEAVRYEFALRRDNSAVVDPLVDRFLMSSGTLTNPQLRDAQGIVEPQNYFGYRLETGGTATRFLGGVPDFANGNFIDGWFWSSDPVTGVVTVEARWSQFFGGYADCDLAEDFCNRWRIRTWIPLSQVGDRIYVLEEENWNGNTWAFPSQPETYTPWIPQRIQFFEAFEMDLDGDGTIDANDDDIDGDGVLNGADAFPENAAEDTDSDGDGVGDNSDPFPTDPNEAFDTDNDGIGNESDFDIDGDGISNDAEYVRGFNPFNASDVDEDADNDGWTNGQEITSGTDPYNDQSVPQAGVIEFMDALSYANEDEGVLTVRLQRLHGVAGAASVDVVTADEMAVAGVDYTAVNQTVSWADGEGGVKSVDIPLVNDTDIEADEAFYVNLQQVSGAVLGRRSDYAIIFNDDGWDPAVVAHPGHVGIMDGLHVIESAGFAELQVIRYRGSQGAASVEVRAFESTGGIDIHATGPEDFEDDVYLIEWADGESGVKSVQIPIYDDLNDEGKESFGVQLQNATGTTIGFSSASIHIIDDDVNHPEGVIGTVGRGAVADEQQGYLDIDFERRYGSQGAVSVNLDLLDSSAFQGQDYVTQPTQSLTWADGEAGIKTVRVTLIDDTDWERVEFFLTLLTSPTGNARLERDLGGYSLGLGVIFDGGEFDVNGNLDGDGFINAADRDLDGDGIDNPLDAFPIDGNETADSDGDGVGDNADVFPNDPAEAFDFDTDGIGDNADTDDDNDNLTDQQEIDNGLNPYDPSDALADFDNDGFSNLEEIQGFSDINDPQSLPFAGFIEFSTGLSEASEEGGTITVNLHRIRGASGEVSVTWDAFDVGNMIEGQDYLLPADRTVTWAAGESGIKSFTIDVIDDAIQEAESELGRLRLSSPTGGAVLGSYEAQFIIWDDDQAVVGPFAGFVTSAWYEVKVDEGQGFVEMEIARWAGSDGAISVDVEMVQGGHLFDSDAIDVGAEIGVDVSADILTLDWADGEIGPKRIQIPITDDNEPEQTERFLVRLINPTGGVHIPFNDAGVNIIDNDTFHPQGRIGFATRMPFADEESGQIEVIVTRDLGTQGQVSVDFTQFWQNGEFTPINQTLTWLDGENHPQSVVMQLTDDPDAFTELFLPVITNTQGGALLDRQQIFEGNLLDTSQSVVIVFDFADTDFVTDTDSDGSPDFADFDQDNDGVRNWDDAFPLDNTEDTDSDGDGVGDNADAFPNDASEQVDTDGDGVGDNKDLDPNDPNVASVPGIIEFHVSQVFVNENATTATLHLQRVLGFGGAVSVDIDSRGTATAVAGQEFVAVNETVSWADGETGIKTVDVTILDDATPEAAGVVYFDLSNPTGDARIGQGTALIGIFNDDFDPDVDSHPGLIGVTGATRVIESAGVLEFQLLRYSGRMGEVSVDVELQEVSPGFDVPAFQGEDFEQPLNPTVIWADGEMGVKTIQIPIVDDFNDEDEENVRVWLHNEQGGVGIGLNGWAFTIIDDDVVQPEGVIQFVSREFLASEDQGFADVVVARRFGSDLDVSVQLNIGDFSAVSPDDFTASSQTLTWLAGDDSNRVVTVPIVDDAIYDEGELFIPSLSNVSGGARLGRKSPWDTSAALGVISDSADFDSAGDIDGDLIVNSADRDVDGDGRENSFDRFPLDASEQDDADNDGIGDNADLDDDNDGISDVDEIANGLNPLDGGDADGDNDGDGASNRLEIEQGTDPNDINDFPLTVADAPIADGVLHQCAIDTGVLYAAELQELWCGYQGVSDLTGISSFSNLRLIQIDGFQADLDFTELAGINSLEDLQVWNSVFDDTDFMAFQNHPNLAYISAGNTLFSNASFSVVVPSLPNLMSMHIWGDWNATPPAVFDLSVLAGNPTFRELALNWQQIGDGANGAPGNGLTDLFAIPQLRRLWVGGPSAAQISQLAAGLSPDMEHISFGSNEFGDAQLIEIANAFPNLQSLDVGYTNVTNLTPILSLNNLNDLQVNLAPIDTSIVDPYSLPFNVGGNIANGEPLPAHLDQIADPTLRECVANHTQGLLNTGQIDWLDCGNSRVTELHGLWPFHNLTYLGVYGTPIFYLDGIQGLPELRTVDLSYSLTRDLGALYSLPNLQEIYLQDAPLEHLNDYDAFVADQNIWVNGSPNQGELIDDIVASMSDSELIRCVQDQRGSAQYASQLLGLDCSGHNGYTVYNLYELDRFIALADFGFNVDHGDPIDYNPLFAIRALSNFYTNSQSWDDGYSWALGGMERIQYAALGGTSITDLEPFRNSINLRSLGLWVGSSLDLSPLFDLPVFESLSLNRSQIDINQLLALPHLVHLGLNGDLSSFDRSIITQLTQLTHLQVGYTQTVGNVEVSELTTALPNLTSFGAPRTLLDDLNAIFDFDRIMYLDVSETPITDFGPAIANSNLMQISVWETTITQPEIDSLVANNVQVDGGVSTDTDGDGVADSVDEFPNDANEAFDSDGDGVGNNADIFPFDPSEQTDTDGDGVGDNSDLDPNDPNVSVSSGVVELSISETYVIENQPFAEIRVHRMLGDAGAVSVTVNSVDTLSAVAGVDYSAVSEVVNWADGESGIKVVQLPVIDNAVPEAEKYVKIVLDTPTGGAEIGQREGFVLILSDDYTPGFDQHPGYFGIGGGFRVDESAGYVEVSVHRYGGSQGVASVDVYAEEPFPSSLNIPATNGVDFGQPLNPTLTWADGEAGTKIMQIPIIDDFEDEGTETLRLRLNNPVGAGVAYDGFGISIEDDDVSQAEGMFTFTNREFFAPEDNGPLNIDVARRHGTQGAATVDVVIWDGDATLADDFIGAAEGTLAWADGEGGVKTLSLVPNDDVEYEGFHVIIPRLTNPTGGARLNRERNGESRGLAFLVDVEDINEGTDLDTDGIVDVADRDRDNDGVDNVYDRFPDDGSEWSDFDFDGIGDNADTDDDGDGIPDVDEPGLGLDPLNGGDAFNDKDGDGADNLTEYNAGSDPNDPNSTPPQVANLVFPDPELAQCVADTGAFYVGELTELYCGYRNLTDLTGISGLTSLQMIQVDGFQNDLDFTELASMPSLENLQVWNSVFDDTDLLAFQNHPNLAYIYAGNVQISDAAFRVVMPSLPNLTGMHLWGDPNGTPPAIFDLSVLSGSSLRELAINLEQIGNGGNGVPGNGLGDVSALPNLRWLWMGGLVATDVDFLTDPVSGLSPDMEFISFYSWEVGNAQLQQIVDAFPNLTGIEVEATNVTDLTPILALQNLQSIRVNHAPIDTSIVDPYQLGIQVSGNIADGEPLPGHLDTIYDPTLRQCVENHTQGMTDTGQLGWLDCGNSRVSELHGLWAFHNLEYLGLYGTVVFYLDGIDGLPELRTVDMNGSMVRNLGVLYSLPNLQDFYVSDLPLESLDDYNNFVNDPNIWVDGTPNQGDLIDDIVAAMSDSELVRCVGDNRGGATYASQFHFMDCSDYNGYDVRNLYELDRLIGLDAFYVNVSHNDAMDFNPLFGLRGLTQFATNSSSWDDGWSWGLGGMERIREIYLGGTNISDLEPFRNTVNLRAAGLWGSNQLNLEPLFGLPIFEDLYLDRQQLNIDQLLSLPQLLRLGINGDLSAYDINLIGQLDQLQYLQVGWSPTIGDTEITQLTQELPNLESISVAGSQITGLASIFDINRFTYLDVSQTAVSDFSLAISSPNLQNINIDNTTISQADINALIANGVTVDGMAGVDTDGDGVADNVDAFPNDANEQFDSDGDGVGDNADELPNNPNEQVDSDGDGVGDNSDPEPNNPAVSSLPGIVELAVNEPFVTENQGVAEVQLHRILGDAGAVDVTFETFDTQSAQAGIDYTSVTQVVSWADGETGVKKVSVPLIDNGAPEGVKAIKVLLSAATGGAELGVRQGVVSVLNDDFDPALDQHPGYFGISGGYRVAEDAGFVEVEVVRYGGSQGAVSVDVAAGQPNFGGINVPATSGQDFLQPNAPTISWADGESGVKTAQIPIVDDFIDEGTEILNLNLTNPVGAAIGYDGWGIEIADDDVYQNEGLVGFTTRTFFAPEDNGPLLVDVFRRGGSSGAISVDYNIWNGSADTNTDFSGVSDGTLFWGDGDASVKTISLNIVDDADRENFEYLVTRLHNPNGGARIDRDTGGQTLSLAFVTDPEDTDESADLDGDLVADVADRDRDGDGVENVFDPFPDDGSESMDSDGDGVGDNSDAFPNDGSEQFDFDGDGTGDNADADDDNDGIDDQAELDNGLNPFDASDAAQDPDNDGFTNLQEIQNGTDPYVADVLISSALDPAAMPDAELRACVTEATGGLTYTSELTQLYCSWRPIGDLTGIDAFGALEIIHLDGVEATGFNLLANISALRELEVNNSDFNDAALAAFNGHPSLFHLSISFVDVSTEGLKAANNIPNLANFNAWGPDTLLIDFAHYTALDLEAFSANRNQIVDLSGLLQYPNLSGLWIQGGIEAGDDAILAQLTQLGHLHLAWMNLDDALLDTITANMNNLHTLEISNNNITDLSVIYNIPNLSHINIDLLPLSDPNQVNDPFFSQITIVGIVAQGEPLPAFLDQVADPTLRGCLQGATAGLLNTGQLTWLDCNYQKVADIEGLWAFPNIEHLDISGTGVIDINVLGGNQRIRELIIQDTPVRDIGVTHPMDTLQYLNLNNALLVSPSQADPNNFVSTQLFIEGSPNQGADLATIQGALSGDLLQCFNDNQVINGWQFAAEVHYLDCSDYMPGAYNVTSLAGIENLVALNTLHIFGSSVADYSPLFNMPALESISITNVNFDDNNLQTIANGSRRLGNANIGGTSVTDLSVALAPAVNLYAIHLWNNTAYDLNHLTSFERLDMIAANTSQLDLTLLTPGNFPNVRNLFFNGALTASEITGILAFDLYGLGAGFDDSVGNAEFNQFTAGLPNLNYLDIQFTTTLTDISSVVALDKLEVLNIGNTNVTTIVDLGTIAVNQVPQAGVLREVNLEQLTLPDAEVTALQALGVQVNGNYISAP